jgi:D-alanyl-D-alanine carboxypeptidase
MVSGDVNRFVDAMNAEAATLGLDDTHFVNPHGLDRRQHYSSAYDLSMLARAAMARPEFAEIVNTRQHRLAPPSDYDLFNGNTLLDKYPGADGVKIGWTERAGWTLVASAVHDGRRVYVTVLNSTDRDADAAALFDWAWQSVRWTPVGPGADTMLRIAERLGVGEPLRRALLVCA